MKKSFWQKLKRPLYVMAPMAGITDAPFRQICKEQGADVLYSEMVSAAALHYGEKRGGKSYFESLRLASFSEIERPFVVQLFGSEPAHFASAGKLISDKIKPDGIDINFGCPVKKVMKQGAGSALMADLKRSHEVIKALIGNTDLPVSIKIRAGSGAVDALKFLDNISDLKIYALMLHGRTLPQMFSGPIDTDLIKKSRDYFAGIIMANGGVFSLADAKKILSETKADGIGIGRGAMGKPWLFAELKAEKEITLTQSEIFANAIKHAELAEEIMGSKGILEMRKHLGWYLQGFPGAKEMRVKLNQVTNLSEIKKILAEGVRHLPSP